MKNEHIKIVRDHFQDSIPLEVERMARLALADLYTGPLAGEIDDYPGFTKALKTVQEWARDISVLYIEDDSGAVHEKFPDGEVDEDGYRIEPEDIWELSRREVLSALFGKELSEYL